MSTDMLNIEWSDFQTNFCSELSNLFKEDDFTDVTLATADDQQLKAHKVILSSSSPFFKKIFKKNTHKNPLIYLKGIHCNELESIMK